MSNFNTETFVAEIRDAARGERAVQKIRDIMQEAVNDTQAVAAALGPFDGDDIILYEDETISIQHCRFDPGLHVPPHDHRITAIIGVYAGGEINHFYTAGDGPIKHKATKRVLPGDVVSMGPEAIHSVEAATGDCGYAIHVYLGPLSTVERSLYDWDSGAVYRYTRDKYDELLRHNA